MTKSRYVVLILAVTLGAVASGVLHAQRETEQPEGNTPYSPTKLEWLALLCNSEQRNGGEILTSFRPHETQANTIQAQVFYPHGEDKRMIDAHRKIAQQTVTRISKQLGFDWAQVEVQAEEVFAGLRR